VGGLCCDAYGVDERHGQVADFEGGEFGGIHTGDVQCLVGLVYSYVPSGGWCHGVAHLIAEFT